MDSHSTCVEKVYDSGTTPNNKNNLQVCEHSTCIEDIFVINTKTTHYCIACSLICITDLYSGCGDIFASFTGGELSKAMESGRG